MKKTDGQRETGLIQVGDLKHGQYDKMNRVYSVDGCSPVVETPSGGGKMPKIEVDLAGVMKDTVVEQARRVYDPNGKVCSITAGGGTGSIPKIEVVGNLTHIHHIQGSNVYSVDGISPTVLAGKRMGDGTLLKIQISGEIESNYDQAKRVYNTDGIAPAMKSRDYKEPVKIEVNEIQTYVRVRKHNVDQTELAKFLKDAKKKVGLSNKTIAERLSIPITEVEHWFRTDRYGCIPEASVWFRLKEILELDTDEWDLPITEFVEVENNYERSQRCYSTDGVSPTLTNQAEVKIEVVKDDH